MATKEQVMKAVRDFIYNDILLKTDKPIRRMMLRGAASLCEKYPGLAWDIACAKYPVLKIAEDAEGNVNTEVLGVVAIDALGPDEFHWEVCKEFDLAVNADDVRKILSYL
jgi:hypothetical protein